MPLSKSLTEIKEDEPVITGALIQSFVTSVLTLIVAFGVDLTKEQTTAIVGITAVVAPVIVAMWQRHKVVPVASVEESDH